MIKDEYWSGQVLVRLTLVRSGRVLIRSSRVSQVGY